MKYRDLVLLPIVLMKSLGSPLINWQGDIAPSDSVRGYKNIKHRSQPKLRRLSRQRRK